MRTKLLNTVLVAGLSFAMVACGGDDDRGGNKSVDAFGNCTEAFVSAYNSVTSKINATYSSGIYLGNPANLESIDSSCNGFLRDHNSVGCNARVDGSKNSQKISSDDIKPMCADAKLRLNAIKGRTAQVQVTPAAAPSPHGNQDPIENECTKEHIDAYEVVVDASEKSDEKLGELCASYKEKYGKVTCESDISPRERAKITPETLVEICKVTEDKVTTDSFE